MDWPKRLWTKIARLFDVLDGIDDPIGEYIFSLERDVGHLQEQVHARP